MKPLPITTMQIEVYNVEESPLHQIVKKLIYKKILDLEPYNFNYVFGEELEKLVYGSYASTSDRKEIRETMTWNHSCIPTLCEKIKEKALTYCDYDPNPFRASRRASTFIPLRCYKDKVFMEYAFFLDGLRIIPDITLIDEKHRPETAIEILYTSLPNADKLIKYIESDLNVIFVFANEAIERLSTDMTCRRDYFDFPIREAWSRDTPKKAKISRAVNILLHKKLNHRKNEYIISKKVIKNTSWLEGSPRWRKNRMNIGLRMETNEGTTDLSHSMIQMKETSSLIILLRYLQKYTEEETTINNKEKRPTV
jgi:hypothetical protein|tara:strand:+ start:177 stop:1106 length:930 start_codon:yes stop_codon:yes gene_type:complete